MILLYNRKQKINELMEDYIMQKKVELISTKKDHRNFLIVTVLINNDFFKSYQFSGYTKKEAIKKAIENGKTEAQKYIYNI
jgi:hypothetical protein